MSVTVPPNAPPSVQVLLSHTGPVTQDLEHVVEFVFKWAVLHQELEFAEHIRRQYAMQCPSCEVRNDLLSKCVNSGRMKTVLYLQRVFPLTPREVDDSLLWEAAANGHLDMVRYIEDAFEQRADSETFCIAVERGYLDIVKHFCASSACKPKTDDILEACLSGGTKSHAVLAYVFQPHPHGMGMTLHDLYHFLSVCNSALVSREVVLTILSAHLNIPSSKNI